MGLLEVRCANLVLVLTLRLLYWDVSDTSGADGCVGGHLMSDHELSVSLDD